jgi:hypothetical protein
VRVIGVPGRYYDKLITMFAAGTPPDVFVINHGRMGDFARRGLLADLKPLAARTPELDRSRFVTAAYDSFAAVGTTVVRPGLLGLPRDRGPTNLLVFNKAAFEAAVVARHQRGRQNTVIAVVADISRSRRAESTRTRVPMPRGSLRGCGEGSTYGFRN